VSINNPQINSLRSTFLLDTVSSRQSNTDWIDLVGSIGTYGWFSGGAPANYSNVDRIDFANDTASPSARGNLPFGMLLHTAAGNANYGWIACGNNPGNNSLVHRIDYANDSPTSPSPRGPLSVGRSVPIATANSNYGWFSGGVPGPLSRVDRIDFANDSPAISSIRGPLSVARGYSAATGNANYAWLNGGELNISTVDRIDYSTDSPTSASPRGPLSNSISYSGAGTGNANYGWFAGGQTPGNPGGNATVSRIDFANDTTTGTARGLLAVARYQLAAAGNANFGWLAAGSNTGADFSHVDRIDFANDSPTASSQRAVLPFVRRGGAGSSNYVKPLIVPRSATSINPGAGTVAVGNANYGWFGGGTTVPAPAVSIVDRIDFSNDSPTSASPRGPLSQARGNLASASNANYGWFAGGYLDIPNTYSTVDRIDFANDSPSSASPRSNLNKIRWLMAATSNANYGWFGGGQGPSAATFSDIYRIDFANDSPASGSPRGPLNVDRITSAATGNANYGWFGGGSTPGPVVSSVDRIDYANDSPAAASSRGPLSSSRFAHAAAGNANYGWFAAGGGPLSTVDRIDFSNDSPTSASARGILSQTRSYLCATSNANYGWFSGGRTPAPVTSFSIVDRIDFSNDSPTAASPRGVLSTARYTAGASSNYVKSTFPIMLGDAENYGSLFGGKSYGWFGGGQTASPGSTSSTDRIDFSNDSPTSASIRGPISAASYQAATGNANYGWFGGGYSPTAISSIVNRIDFTNDSPTAASPRGPLSSARYFLAAISNANFGWWGGGGVPAQVSTVDRIDFANDSPASASPRGPLSASRWASAATGNANYGWFAGGSSPSVPSNYSIVDRVDFSNDSPTSASRRGPLSLARPYLVALSNSQYGWWAGGNTGSNYSNVDRIDFSNDSPTSASPRGPLSLARYSLASSGNANYGWVAGGVAGANRSIVDRIDYSNDTNTASLRGPLSSERARHSATSNYVKTSSVSITNTGFSVPQYAKTVNPVGIGGTYGWVISGYLLPAPARQSTISRIDFSNDTGASSVRGPLPVSTFGVGGVSNSSYGWSAGGFSSLSTIYRIDYSNDSPTSASQKSNLPTPLQDSGSVSNAYYGWFGAGNGPTILSSVSRLNFSNDLVNPSVRASLSVTRYLLTAAGNNNYGWFAGGSLSLFSTPGNSLTSVERIDFNNDSPTSSSPRGNLTVARAGVSASSNANYGWFSGGQTTQGTNISSVERIDFSNDSPTSASTRGPLSSARYLLAAAGNNNYGWFAGGAISSGPTAYSTVDRIDYSNDSPTAATPRGTLNTTLWYMGSTSNYVK